MRTEEIFKQIQNNRGTAPALSYNICYFKLTISVHKLKNLGKSVRMFLL